MIYRVPDERDESALAEYAREHVEAGEQSLSASMGLKTMPYEDWLDRIHRNETEGDGEWGRSLLYLCCEGERIVGLLSVRYELSEALVDRYGHIGYGVRPSERGQGRATDMLRHGLLVCRERGLAQVVVGCYADNAASDAVIRKCGGMLLAENDRYKAGRLSRYYTIEL